MSEGSIGMTTGTVTDAPFRPQDKPDWSLYEDASSVSGWMFILMPPSQSGLINDE